MRGAFIEALLDLAQIDERVFLLTGDLGWTVVETFAARYPERFLNTGVAEQNMAGVAAGLAQAGFIPFVYSIATFSSMRCYEQIRNGAVLHHLPVRFVGIGGGFAYGHAGPTHYALEDLTITRTQPGLTVLVPADPPQTRSVLQATASWPGPIYLRIGKGGNAPIPGLNGRFAFGRPEEVRQGRELLFLACGGIVHEALIAADALREHGVSAAVAVMAHLPFAATDPLVELLSRFPHVVTLEEGYAAGGLGSLIAETIARHCLACRLRICGVVAPIACQTGGEKYLRGQYGLDARALAEAALACLTRQ